MDILSAFLARRQLNVVLRRSLPFHLDDLVSSVLTSGSSGGRNPCESGSIRVECILVVLSSLSLLSSDGLLRIKCSVHEIDVVLITWASVNHVFLQPRVPIEVMIP